MGRADSPLRDRVVFVVGARRSGTNWLARILTAHPSVVGLPSETYLFSHGVARFAELVQHANPGSMVMGKVFMERAEFLDAIRELVDRVFLDNLERLGPDSTYLVERTPAHVSHLGLIAEVYPDARAIHVVRDGRAVARSLVSMDWGPDTIEEAAREWCEAIDGGRAGVEALGDRYREVRYEDLLADPRARAAELFDWLGLGVTDAEWERVLAEAGSEFNVDPGSPGVRADKWRDELSDDEVRAVERVAGERLQAAGYELAGDPRAGVTRGRPPSGRFRVPNPRAAARAAVGRALSRRARRELHRNYQLVEYLQSLLHAGSDDEVLALFDRRARVRVVDGDAAFEGHGEEGVRRLLGTVAEHRARGLSPQSGEIHASPTAFTVFGTYTLDDGSRWARTLVVTIRGHRVATLALYRQRLYM